MNRPMLEDYYDASQAPTFEYDMDAYFKDLEKYCDVLEKREKPMIVHKQSPLKELSLGNAWFCPNCENWLIHGNNDNYCPNCGQRVVFEDVR